MSMTLYEYITQNMTTNFDIYLNSQFSIDYQNESICNYIEPTSKSFYLPACFIRTKFTLYLGRKRISIKDIYTVSCQYVNYG